MRVGLDIDNVISAFDDSILEEFYIEDKNKRNKGIINPDGSWIKYQFDWSSEEIEDFFNNNMERIAKKLKLRRQAKFYMDKLLKDGHELYLISHRAYPHYIYPRETTEKWLKENNVNYTKLILSETTNKSKECIENSVDVMFDDVQSNCNNLIDAGVECYLVETRYNNRNNHNLPMVRNWEEIYKKVCDIDVKKFEKVHVILDTDTNNEADDQFALAYLLKSKDRAILDAVTIAPYSHENGVSAKEGIEESYNVANKVFELVNEDSTNMIFKGSMGYMTEGYEEENEAVNRIIQIANKNEITYILAIGAITNIALAIKKCPEIKNKIRVIWLGGHSFLSDNNMEYNFRQDVEANRYVFNSKVDLTIIPCNNVASNLTTSIYELENYFDITKGLGKYLYDKFYNDGIHGITKRRVIWDISAVAYIINPYWFEKSKMNCPDIDNENNYFRYIKSKVNHKVTFINYLNANKIYEDMFKKIGDKNKNEIN